MQKKSLTNKITPCCNLPFSVMYFIIENLTLNSEADRTFLKNNIRQNGMLSIDAWKVWVNSGTLESDASLTKAEFLAWFDCERQPSCAQLKLLIEGYKLGNYDPMDEYGVGWTETYILEQYDGKLIKKITGYVGGIGVLPDELNERVGLYFGDEILTDNKDLAVDFIGQDGANGTAEIPDWIAQNYVQKSLVIYNDSIYRVTNGKTATATDIPSDDSLVWKSMGGGQFTKENLQIILGDDVPTDVTKKYGDDLTYASTTSSPTTICNFNYLKSSEKITKLVFVALSVGSINIYKVNAGVNPNNGSPFSKTLIKNANVVVGTNYISLDINGVVGDMISVDTNGVTVGYTDGGTGGYFDAKNIQNVSLNIGHVAYYFETSVTERTPANIDALKEIVKYSSDDVKRVFDDDIVEISKLIEVSRITLEGQSNALGVGYKSELSLAPFTNIQRDWSAPIDRVYIWEPFSQEYQKLQIGVNNMASWDSRFTIGAPTAFPTFGSEVGIALNFLKTNKSGLLFIDKNVGDGQPISYFQKGTAYYAEKLARKTNADKWLIDRGFQPKEVGFVWVQGESDMGSPEANYRTALNKLLSDRIADGFIKNGTRRVITQVGSTSSNYGSGVKSAKDAYVASDLKAKIVTYTNNYNSDNVHLNAVGEVNLGLQSAREILLTDNITIADL